MSKRFNTADITQKHGNELTKKLYRSITDQSKRLDDAKSCARNVEDLFKPNLVLKRRKFCEYCERLIFTEPLLYGKKGEELLWRKVFYDVVSTAKHLKNVNFTPEEISNLENHICAGIGFYHHLISKLQLTYRINVVNVFDFPLSDNETEQNCDNDTNYEWAEQAIHQCLMYLGDLSRYKLEINSDSDKSTPIRYYMQAVALKPDNGVPYNQMGTLAMNMGCHLDAVYHYMRCLACKYSFEGTSSNLIALFEKNSKFIEQLPQQNDTEYIVPPTNAEHVKRCLARFLLLIDIWYFDKKVTKIHNLCHATFRDLDECLCYQNSENDAYLSDATLFRIIVICLLCIAKLRTNNSPHISTVTAFVLAIYSRLIQKVIARIEDNVLKYPLAQVKVKKKSKQAKLLRRRRKFSKNGVSEDSDSSDDNLSISSSDSSFLSGEEDLLAESSGDELQVEEKAEVAEIVDPKAEIFKNIKEIDVNDMLDIISEETTLQSIKIFNDWCMMDSLIIKSCSISTPKLLKQITHLLNLINVNIQDKKLTDVNLNLSNVNDLINIPLTEDVVLKGFDCISNSQKNIDWKFISKRRLTMKEETIIRVVKLSAFGKHLISIQETGIIFDDKKKIYICNNKEEELKDKDAEVIVQNSPAAEEPLPNGKVKNEDLGNPNGGQLLKMKHMGQLWLASEVNALENRVRGKASLSPYLVLDADALITYNFMVKQLVHSRKFIVLVPHAVVSALDDLKREKPEARDAIRWLEMQFHQGNRFFRSQRPQERSSIPFVKYPKKKNKEMSTYIQIIECCYYLLEQQKGMANLVTLLIGNQKLLTNVENKEFSYLGLAQSAGITIESIAQFYAKSKNKGNR